MARAPDTTDNGLNSFAMFSWPSKSLRLIGAFFILNTDLIEWENDILRQRTAAPKALYVCLFSMAAYSIHAHQQKSDNDDKAGTYWLYGFSRGNLHDLLNRIKGANEKV